MNGRRNASPTDNHYPFDKSKFEKHFKETSKSRNAAFVALPRLAYDRLFIKPYRIRGEEILGRPSGIVSEIHHSKYYSVIKDLDIHSLGNSGGAG